MINLRNINLSFGSQEIFKDLSLAIHTNKKIGLIGNNGTGKTTLFKILSKEYDQYSGVLELPKNISIGYLPQHATLLSDKTVLEEAMNGDIESQLPEYEVKIILEGLGFVDKLDKKVAELSTGWQMRLLLAKLLATKADFYLFDEPTNHLDITTKEWLLKKLKTLPGFILISHERYFLDKLPEQIIELDQATATLYHGNFSQFKTRKSQEQELLLKAYQEQQREIQEKIKTIERFKAKASKAKMAQSMMKKLDKVELITPPTENNITANFLFPNVTKSGSVVLNISKLSHAYETQKIIESVDFEINRNEKVSLIAPNGIGKTTLLKLIAGKLQTQSGKINFGHNVSLAYFEQDNAVSLPQNLSIIDYITRECETSEEYARSFLGSFLFCKDTIYKKITILSGGEKNRLCMAKTLLKKSNFLLLDEPTNHLDITTKELLANALTQYPGTVLFVSHDQHFINNVATRILKLNNFNIESYPGNYDDYLEFAKNSTDSVKESKTERSPKKINKDLTRQLSELEKQIKKTEERINKLELKLGEIDYSDPNFNETVNKIDYFKQEAKELLQKWEELFEKS